jgi:hypothetical protein
MNQTLVKPLAMTAGGGGGNGGSGNGYTLPALTLSIAITSPNNNDAVVDNNGGVSLTSVCTVNVGGLITNEQWANSMKVSVLLGSHAPKPASLTSGDWTANGTTTWTYTGPTPYGGPGVLRAAGAAKQLSSRAYRVFGRPG